MILLMWCTAIAMVINILVLAALFMPGIALLLVCACLVGNALSVLMLHMQYERRSVMRQIWKSRVGVKS